MSFDSKLGENVYTYVNDQETHQADKKSILDHFNTTDQAEVEAALDALVADGHLELKGSVYAVAVGDIEE